MRNVFACHLHKPKIRNKACDSHRPIISQMLFTDNTIIDALSNTKRFKKLVDIVQTGLFMVYFFT